MRKCNFHVASNKILMNANTSCGKLMGNVPNSVIPLNWMPIFEWCVVWCGYEGRYHKDICLKEIGSHAKSKDNEPTLKSQHNQMTM